MKRSEVFIPTNVKTVKNTAITGIGYKKYLFFFKNGKTISR